MTLHARARGPATATSQKPARELSIDEVARLAGTTVRNVRAYQDRGLVPKPVRRGRKGIYTDVHLARLRVITQLLERGYSLANIGELIDAWQSGRDLHAILGFEAAIASPFSPETPAEVSAAELELPFAASGLLPAAIELGLVVPAGDRYVVPSPRTLRAGAELIAAGVPGKAAIGDLRQLRKDIERVAGRLVALVVEHVLGGRAAAKLPKPAEIDRLATLLWRLRPAAQHVVEAELARALDGAARQQLGDRLDRVLAAMSASRQPRAS